LPLAAIPFGLGIGLRLGMLGGGGSVWPSPCSSTSSASVHQTTTASLVVVTAGAVVGGLSHARRHTVCWRHATAFTDGALPGVLAGTAQGRPSAANPEHFARAASRLDSSRPMSTWMWGERSSRVDHAPRAPAPTGSGWRGKNVITTWARLFARTLTCTSDASMRKPAVRDISW
jgi:hypothetical protein